jgi:hypothetical protein
MTVRRSLRRVSGAGRSAAAGRFAGAPEPFDARHAPAAVGHARLVHDDIDRRSHLFADRDNGHLHACHQHHGLEARQRVTRRVGVQCAHRTVVARIHRL